MTILRKSALLMITLSTTAFIAFNTHAEDYYRWVGEDGVTHYGTTPPKNVEAVLVTTYGDKAKAQKSAGSTTQSASNTGSSSNTTEAQNKLQAQREQECDQEEQRLATLQNKGRIRMTQEDGTSRYLTVEEIAAEINQSKTYLKEACGQ